MWSERENWKWLFTCVGFRGIRPSVRRVFTDISHHLHHHHYLSITTQHTTEKHSSLFPKDPKTHTYHYKAASHTHILKLKETVRFVALASLSKFTKLCSLDELVWVIIIQTNFSSAYLLCFNKFLVCLNFSSARRVFRWNIITYYVYLLAHHAIS